MTKVKGLELKDLLLERVPSLPPANRIAFLVDEDEACKLTPLTTPFLDMQLPIGVYTRPYEEFHYLDRLLSRQVSAYLMKEFAKSHSISSIAAQVSPAVSLLDQMKIPDWAERANSIASEFTDPMEAARKAALGDSSYYLDQHLAPSNWAVQAASGFPDSTVGSVARDIANSESAYRAAMGSSFMPASEAVAGLNNNYPSLLEDEIRESLQGSNTSIQDAIAPQFADISEPKSTLPPVNDSPFQYIEEQNARLREEQRKRDDWLKQQAENSKALLQAQRENDQKAEEDRKFSKRMTVIGLIIAGVGAIGTFVPIF